MASVQDSIKRYSLPVMHGVALVGHVISVIFAFQTNEKDDQINMPDNVTIAPWGDLIVCEDNSKINRLWGFNQTGGSYLIAENSYTGSEFAGVCFSPLDNTMYVNLQYNGMTLAIDGNWKKLIR